MLRVSHRTVNVRQSNKRLSTTSTLCNFGRQMKIGLAAKGLIYLNEQSDAVNFIKESCFGQLGVISENL